MKILDEQQIVCLRRLGKEVRGDNEEIKIKGGEGGGGGHSLFHHEGCRSSCHSRSSPGAQTININTLKYQMSQKIAHDNIFERRLPTGLAVVNFLAMATSQQVSDHKSKKIPNKHSNSFIR